MTLSNLSELTLDFHVSQLNQKSMSITFVNNDLPQTIEHLDEGEYTYKTKIEFPTKFIIKVAGKGPRDTQIDDQGNILKDMCIKLTNITVDGLSCSPEYVYHHITLHTDSGQVVQSNYWGFNGYVELNFDYTNSFFWALDCSC
jgi:putative lipoic acid-binding regulatory protein